MLNLTTKYIVIFCEKNAISLLGISLPQKDHSPIVEKIFLCNRIFKFVWVYQKPTPSSSLTYLQNGFELIDVIIFYRQLELFFIKSSSYFLTGKVFDLIIRKVARESFFYYKELLGPRLFITFPKNVFCLAHMDKLVFR